MGLHATSLVYSSHNCSPHLHYHWLVERALNSDGKRVLYLPMSEAPRGDDDYERQEFGYGKFRWYLNRFRDRGLRPDTFYWSKDLSLDDAESFFQMAREAEVLILGGGSSRLGMSRYRAMGERFFGDPNKLASVLHERQRSGMLTAGFSAGADQLCDLMCESAYDGELKGFGLSARMAVTLHHEPGRNDTLRAGASRHPWVQWFGLPNDAGIASEQGTLPSGSFYQVLEFIIDTSWDIPEDAFHIKTRHGAKIEHVYADGRHWSFNNQDRLVRVLSHDERYHGLFIVTGDRVIDYWSQEPTGYHNIEHILSTH